MSYPDRCIVIGDEDTCAHVAALWAAERDGTRSFDEDRAEDARCVAGAPSLFGPAPSVVCQSAQKWKVDDLSQIAACAEAFLFCVVSEKSPTPAQKTKWQAYGELVVVDQKSKVRLVLECFARENVRLDNGARAAITARGIDLGKARSMAISASLSGIVSLDERKAKVLLGSSGAEEKLFDVIDSFFDRSVGEAMESCSGIETVVLAQFIAEELRRLVVVYEAGVRGSAAASLVGAPPFAADKLDRRVRRYGARLEAAFLVAAEMDLATRGGGADAREVLARVGGALAA